MLMSAPFLTISSTNTRSHRAEERPNEEGESLKRIAGSNQCQFHGGKKRLRRYFQRKGERKTSNVPIDEIDIECKAGLRGICQELLLALNGKEHRLPTLRDGLLIMKTIEKINP